MALTLNLKTLISIKFFLYIIVICTIAWMTVTLNQTYGLIDDQNVILLKQKTLYQQIIDENLVENKVESLKKIELLEQKAITQQAIVEQRDYANLVLNGCFFGLIFLAGIFSWLEKKINILKSEENDFEKQQFL